MSLKSHTTKIILCVIMTKVRSKISLQISEEQFDFRKGKGTNTISVRRILSGRANELQKALHAIFLDLTESNIKK